MRDLAAYQDSYGRLPFEATQAHYRKRRILEALATHRPRRILEIGCGMDSIFNHYTDFEHFTVVEPADRFVIRAREQAGSRDAIRIVHGLLEDQVALLGKVDYDFILLSSLLHEVADSAGLLRATASLCNAGTVVHVNVPNAFSFHRLLAFEMGLIKDPHDRSATQLEMQQSHTFDVASLGALAAECGFEVIERGTFFVKPFTHAQMADLQASQLLSAPMLDALYALSRHFPDNGSEIFMNLRLPR